MSKIGPGARRWLLRGLTLAVAAFALVECYDPLGGEIARAFNAPIREARGPMGVIGAQIPGGIRNVTPAIAPLFPIGSDLRQAENRLQKEGFFIHVESRGRDAGKSLRAMRDCGPRSFGFQALCVVGLEFHDGKITKVSAVADEPQGS